MIESTSETFAVLDACFVVGYAAKEIDKYEIVLERLNQYACDNRTLYIPGVAIGEIIWVICRAYEDGKLTLQLREDALQRFREFCTLLKDSPHGDLSLIDRTITIRAPYGPNRSYDAVYIALAEQLTQRGDTVFSTFDERAEKQSKATAPTVKVDLLVPNKSTAKK